MTPEHAYRSDTGNVWKKSRLGYFCPRPCHVVYLTKLAKLTPHVLKLLVPRDMPTPVVHRITSLWCHLLFVASDIIQVLSNMPGSQEDVVFWYDMPKVDQDQGRGRPPFQALADYFGIWHEYKRGDLWHSSIFRRLFVAREPELLLLQ